MNKKEKKKNKRLKNILIASCILIILLIIVLVIGKFRISGTTIYRVTKGECNSTTVNKDESSKLNEKGECINSGYYIDNNRVNINIGSINCANDIEIINLKVDKSRNVKIKVKEKKNKTQAKCMCKPSLNIIFFKKVNSATVTTDKGIILRQCN